MSKYSREFKLKIAKQANIVGSRRHSKQFNVSSQPIDIGF